MLSQLSQPRGGETRPWPGCRPVSHTESDNDAGKGRSVAFGRTGGPWMSVTWSTIMSMYTDRCGLL